MDSRTSLDGILPPITTPFDERGDLDLEALAWNIERYNSSPLRGYVAFGSNGEAAHLSLDEQRRVLETVRRHADDDRTLVAGIHQQSTRAAAEAIRQAASAGADAALVITPYFYKGAMTGEVLKRFFLDLAEKSELPILIYSIPQNTGVHVAPAVIAELAEHPRIAGLKDSSGNLGALCQVLERVDDGFDVLVGNAGILYPALNAGARGGILAVACAVPAFCCELFDAVRAGDHERAQTMQRRLAPVGRAVTSDYGIAGLKTALDLLGWHGGEPRRPLLPLSETQRHSVRQRLEDGGFLT